MTNPVPYKSSPIFDEKTLPRALQEEHRTKRGVWGLIRVIEGEIAYHVPGEKTATILTPDAPGIAHPEQPHWVELRGPVKIQIDFYDQQPRSAD